MKYRCSCSNLILIDVCKTQIENIYFYNISYHIWYFGFVLYRSK